jgi:hypothetical protein
VPYVNLTLNTVRMKGSTYSALKYYFPPECIKVEDSDPSYPVRNISSGVFLSKAIFLSLMITSYKDCGHQFVAKVGKHIVYGECNCYYRRPDGADYHINWEGWIQGTYYTVSLDNKSFDVKLTLADFDKMLNDIRMKHAVLRIQNIWRESQAR